MKKYRSKFEERVAASLDHAGVPFSYETISFKYVRTCSYKTDFAIVGADTVIYVETKGYFTSADRSKALLVREANPGIDLRFLFQRAGNTLSKKSKTTYAQWADKHGFIWAEGTTVPPEWLVNQP